MRNRRTDANLIFAWEFFMCDVLDVVNCCWVLLNDNEQKKPESFLYPYLVRLL